MEFEKCASRNALHPCDLRICVSLSLPSPSLSAPSVTLLSLRRTHVRFGFCRCDDRYVELDTSMLGLSVHVARKSGSGGKCGSRLWPLFDSGGGSDRKQRYGRCVPEPHCDDGAVAEGGLGCRVRRAGECGEGSYCRDYVARTRPFAFPFSHGGSCPGRVRLGRGGAVWEEPLRALLPRHGPQRPRPQTRPVFKPLQRAPVA